jgi:predicted nucleotidyltransferase
MHSSQSAISGASESLFQGYGLSPHEKLIELTRAVIENLIATLPKKPHCIYLTGSVARMTADAASDLDIAIVYPDDADLARGLIKTFFEETKPDLPPLDLTLFDPLEIDGVLHDDDELFRRREILVPIFEHGLLLYGTDMRATLAPHIQDLTRQVTVHMPWVFCRRARGLQERLRPIKSIVPPDTADEFLGYTKFGSIKLLLSIASWIATARLAIYRDFTPIGGKEKLFQVLSKMDPELARWLSEVWFLFRNRWGYKIPEDDAQRERLASICGSVWRMEREFFSDYCEAIISAENNRVANGATYSAH